MGAQQRELLQHYLDLLYQANSRLNLTRVAPADAWERHIEESLDLLPLRDWSPGERVLDLGSGGGLPGIPLAIAVAGLEVILLERNHAKAGFLVECVAQLGLGSVSVEASDAADYARRQDAPLPAVLISRAAVAPGRLLRLGGPLLAPGGEGLVHVADSLGLDAGLRAAAAAVGLRDMTLVRSGRSTLLYFRRP